MTGPLIGCALNWGRDLGVARGHVLVQPRNKFYLKQNATAFVRGQILVLHVILT